MAHVLCEFGIIFATNLTYFSILRKNISVFVVFIAFVFSLSAQKTYKVAAVGFYNVENLFDTINDPNRLDEEFLPDGEKKYTNKIFREKIEQLSSVISKLATETTPDGVALLGVCEVENRWVLEELARHPSLVSRNYQIEHYDSPYNRGVDVALMYNPRYFIVTESEPLAVALKDKKGELLNPTRDVLYVKGLLLGEETHVFVNHWPSRRGGEEASAHLRQQAARVVRDKIDQIYAEDDDAHIIVMGDLNDDPNNISVAEVLNAGGKIGKLNEGQLYNPFYNLYRQGIGSLAWNDSWNLFDQIIISQSLLKDTDEDDDDDDDDKPLFFKRAEVYNRPHLTQKSGNFKGYPWRTYIGNEYAGGYSDHFPTIVYLYKLK